MSMDTFVTRCTNIFVKHKSTEPSNVEVKQPATKSINRWVIGVMLGIWSVVMMGLVLITLSAAKLIDRAIQTHDLANLKSASLQFTIIGVALCIVWVVGVSYVVFQFLRAKRDAKLQGAEQDISQARRRKMHWIVIALIALATIALITWGVVLSNHIGMSWEMWRAVLWPTQQHFDEAITKFKGSTIQSSNQPLDGIASRLPRSVNQNLSMTQVNNQVLIYDSMTLKTSKVTLPLIGKRTAN
ncbi:hypothetical protein NEHOM01_1887 [Nematocida homosporus]|uniref:uncharacterized protein n=1 Tax=Nematocida homosporus TaxID=1912981 RepID=UPI00221E8F50|nr:uncharacterized protein NEHOM01_1887 [Nematocida homosporus]KAI5187042.1 hypothetical protein NEHOM01_1887 [Nematocida homosporus]